ncbi:hypothetical protein C2845_PM05G28120 [Panicum miliaceum]|uniref:DUF6598 domain-containing protein n=1 Tax=Panicum miliaceum TaxID=4540 RepID=A0A3L6T4B7_PANMI|nr:hypothetical protein C2845_PM05G28120 [Panicum miliaceum]
MDRVADVLGRRRRPEKNEPAEDNGGRTLVAGGAGASGQWRQKTYTGREDTLALTDPSRGFAVTCSMFFEIDLRTVDAGSGEAAVLSRGVIEHNACVSDGKLATKLLESWRSTVRLAYTPVPFATIATLTASVLHGARLVSPAGWSPGPAGTGTRSSPPRQRSAGYVDGARSRWVRRVLALSRRLVAVPVDEKLVIRVHVEDDSGGRGAACFEGTLGHLDDWRLFCHGSYMLEVKAEWNGKHDAEGRVRGRWASGRTRLLL